MTASALAAVAGAVLASELGVYGTILGAAVVSVGATTGSAVFQHLFKRTGEQLRDAVERSGPGPAVNELRQVPVTAGPAGRLPGAMPAGPAPAPSAEWSEPQVVRARRRWTWKTYAAVSGLVFVLAMTPIVAFELATGQPVSATVQGEPGSGTSLGGTVGPGSADPSAPAERPAGVPGGGPSGGSSPSAGKDGGASAPATPSHGPGAGRSGTASPSAGPSPSPTGGPSSPAGPSGGPSGGATGTAAPTGGAARPSGGATPQPPAPSGAPAAVSPAAAAPAAGAEG
ncbi:hypothetical protein [Kitasatospora sp. NPDC047058]|uniref:hypothetical protein n=1 Tax=Kitasatospora sp. NPDC047058 TaxID=3155620 RepID=UPI00340BEB7C